MMVNQKVSGNLMIPKKRIERIIFLIRGQKVILDRDLADLYEVTTKALNQASETEPTTVSPGFHVSIDKGRKERTGHKL